MLNHLHTLAQLARAALLEAHIPTKGAIQITVRDEGGTLLRYVLPPGVHADRPLAALSWRESAIVEAIEAEPTRQLTAKAIAARLNTACDGVFRALLTNLAERQPPVLEATHQGYRLADEPQPLNRI